MSESTQTNLGHGKRQIQALPLVGLALAAFVGASCCALPLILASAGLAGAWLANLEIFVVYRTYVTTAAVGLIVIGWGLALRRRPSRRTYTVLGIATVVVLAAVVVTQYEGEITRYLVSLRRK